MGVGWKGEWGKGLFKLWEEWEDGRRLVWACWYLFEGLFSFCLFRGGDLVVQRWKPIL